MKITRIALLFIFLVVQDSPAASIEKERGTEFATAVYWNGPIYPMIEAGPRRIEAIATRGERIIFTGSKSAVRSLIGEGTTIIDLKGKTILPAFTDAHTHPLANALFKGACDLSEMTSLDRIKAEIRKFAEAHRDNTWLVAVNVWDPAFLNSGSPRRLLDTFESDRALVLVPASAHEAWLNSKALATLGITASTEDSRGGRFDREANSREPNGVIHEGALDLVMRALPPATQVDKEVALKEFLREANSFGIVNLVDARADPADVSVYESLAAAGSLTARVTLAAYCDVSKGVAGVQTLIADIQKAHQKNKEISLRQIKIYMDGTVEGKTAALLEPYFGREDSGIPTADQATVDAVIAEIDRQGFQIHVHAIGDRGVRMALNGFQRARQMNGARDARHQIAHLHIVHPNDLPRFKALHITANCQGCWADGDSDYVTKINRDLLGPVRSRWQYPIGTLHRIGTTLVFGSDWPVSSMDPLRAIQIAITRRQPDGKSRRAWTRQHLIDIHTAVTGFTRNGAWITFRENESGSLAPGKSADMVILDADPMRISKFKILSRATVRRTIFKGRVVFERPEE
jgi:predicted amidohydrolase YtcJ